MNIPNLVVRPLGACVAALTLALFASACSGSEKVAGLQSAPSAQVPSSLPEASIPSELHVKNLREPAPGKYAPHYTAEGDIGRACTIALAEFQSEGMTLYEYVVYDGTTPITRGRGGSSDAINLLAFRPPSECV